MSSCTCGHDVKDHDFEAPHPCNVCLCASWTLHVKRVQFRRLYKEATWAQPRTFERRTP